MEWVSGAILKAPAVVAGLDDVAMMGETIEQSRRHLRITEHARPFAKSEICGDDHRGPFVKAADHVEQKLPASLRERQIAEFIKDDEVEPGEIIGEPSLPAGPSFGLEPVDQIDGVLKNRPSDPARMQLRAIAIARCVFPVPVPPMKITLRC